MPASTPVNLLNDQMIDMKFITAFTGLIDSLCHSDDKPSHSKLFQHM